MSEPSPFRFSIRAGLLAGVGALIGGAYIWWSAPVSLEVRLLGIGGSALVAVGSVTALVYFSFAKRIFTLIDFLSAGERRPESLPPLGSDEVGVMASGINELVADINELKADVRHSEQELHAVQERLVLQEELAEKSSELEERLQESELLFDVLRISASRSELDEVMQLMTLRLGRALDIRELAILLREQHDGDEEFVIRSTFGFRNSADLIGRGLAVGEGLAGRVAASKEPLFITDVTQEPEYLSFWGQASQRGAFAAIPFIFEEEVIGIMAMTRDFSEPPSVQRLAFLKAVAHAASLAVHQSTLVSELQELTVLDELTGVGNRRLLTGQLRREMLRARRFGNPLSVLALDIDHFKLLNDRLGHATGDSALRQLGEVMRSTMRSTDTVARSGGEEFLILLPKTNLVDAIEVAKKIRHEVLHHQFDGGDSQPNGRLSVSIGVATLRGSRDSEDGLLKRADEALYFIKEHGRDGVGAFVDASVSRVSSL